MSKIKDKRMSALYECEKCKSTIDIRDNLHQVEYTPVGNKDIKMLITYYDCPSCNKRHYVQIDDSTSILLLRGVISKFGKFIKKKKRGKSISEKDRVNYKDDQKSLADYRHELMRLYNGSVFINSETNVTETVRFSIDYGKRTESEMY